MMTNYFKRWLERRSTIATPPPDLFQMFSAGPTDSGQTVTPTSALTVPAVFSCCQVLSQDVARTPIRLKRQTAPDTFVDAVEHPLYEVLNALWNPEQTAYQCKHYLQWQLLTYGKSYAEIVRSSDGRIVSLWPLDAANMFVDRNAERVKRWTYSNRYGVWQWLFDASQPPVLELVNESPITRCAEIIGLAMGLQQYSARFFLNNAKPAGVLTTDGSIADDTAERLRKYWASSYGGSANAHKVPVLDGGLKFTPIAQNNTDAQLTETLRAVNEQIAGAFRVPSWKTGDMSRTNYSNMESGELAYLTDSLDPYFECWEEALRRDCLTARQYGTYTIQFDRSALVRSDVKSLYASLGQGIQNGYLSQNDARKALGLNPIVGGDTYMINSALTPIGQEVPGVAGS
jgi:HK97 family phage portal protein